MGSKRNPRLETIHYQVSQSGEKQTKALQRIFTLKPLHIKKHGVANPGAGYLLSVTENKKTAPV